MTVAQLKAFLSSGLDFTVADVREEWEWEAAHIANQAGRMLLLPSSSGVLRNDTADGWRRIPPTRPVFVICRRVRRAPCTQTPPEHTPCTSLGNAHLVHCLRTHAARTQAPQWQRSILVSPA